MKVYSRGEDYIQRFNVFYVDYFQTPVKDVAVKANFEGKTDLKMYKKLRFLYNFFVCFYL